MLHITNMEISIGESMKQDSIMIAHGAGGKLTQELVESVFLPSFDNELLKDLEDSALFETEDATYDFTTDSFVVKPLFFPGGDIGRLAVCGTANDLCMMGARPIYLSASFIIEEGFPKEDLSKIVLSMKGACSEAGVLIVAGDTKVVERGSADGVFINTSGLGKVPPGIRLSCSKVRPGDAVIVSGFLGDHEIAVLVTRGEFSIKGNIQSDCAPLNGLVDLILKKSTSIRCMRDPTRGGLATVLNEIARASNVCIVIEESEVPVRDEVRAVCNLLGFDYLYLANEGKLVLFAPQKEAEDILATMRTHPLGKNSAIIGYVKNDPAGKVLLRTPIKGHRVLGLLSGEQFPRIC